jgi:hypothetical protein
VAEKQRRSLLLSRTVARGVIGGHGNRSDALTLWNCGTAIEYECMAGWALTLLALGRQYCYRVGVYCLECMTGWALTSLYMKQTKFETLVKQTAKQFSSMPSKLFCMKILSLTYYFVVV